MGTDSISPREGWGQTPYLLVDGVEKARIDGKTGWTETSFDVVGAAAERLGCNRILDDGQVYCGITAVNPFTR